MMNRNKNFAKAMDESNLYYRFDPNDGYLKQRMIPNSKYDIAMIEGYRGTPEQALAYHGIVRSKFKPGAWIQKQGSRWVEVQPYKAVA